MKRANPTTFKGDNLPVDSVTWNQADAYCRAVEMRLPTEAEWEYAARAGTTKERYGDIDKIAVVDTASTATVGSKLPNAWGLFDMLGNVWEWTNDWYDKDYYKNSPNHDPPGPSSADTKVVRGGSWDGDPEFVRVSDRDGFEPADRDRYRLSLCRGIKLRVFVLSLWGGPGGTSPLGKVFEH